MQNRIRFITIFIRENALGDLPHGQRRFLYII